LDTLQAPEPRSLADAWSDLKAHADAGTPLHADAYRLAFADPEFLLRRETRGIRMQLEMLKPELAQHEQGIENTVVVFGSARFSSMDDAQRTMEKALQANDAATIAVAKRHLRNANYYEQARAFGRIVANQCASMPARERMYICTGGGPGIMEAANRGASEAGELTVGLNIALPHEQSGNPYLTPSLSFKFHYFALRKMHFMMRAKAMVAFPGGFGTLDELFEVITLVQTKKSAPIPIILFGSEYWKRLLNLDVLVEEGAISPEDLNLFQYSDDPQEAWDIIEAFYKTR
jgi:uncharacterized protein (TIGR00730 family)